jgi:transposase
MRGINDTQSGLFSYLSCDQRVPSDHPLRSIKAYADEVLAGMSVVFDAMYSALGRPSIPPERLLKGQLLIALYSVRSDRLFCEMLDYNILFRWFLDMNLEEASFDATTFTKNRDRLLEHEVAAKFFDAVVAKARDLKLLSDEHFTVDGTLIEAWAGMKSFKAKKRAPSCSAPPDDPGNPTINFHGERRSNQTHRSTTDKDARLMRKGLGKEAKLVLSGHVLMENRHGLCVDLRVEEATGTVEREAAMKMVLQQKKKGVAVKTLGGDKGYHVKDFITQLRSEKIAPHIARIAGRKTPGLDDRTTRHEGYRLSQKIRKRVEEIFGWMKTVGGLRKTRFIGIARTEQYAHLTVAAYNLLRLSRLKPT